MHSNQSPLVTLCKITSTPTATASRCNSLSHLQRISELNDVRTPLTLEALFPNPVRAAAATDGNRPLTDFRDSPLVQVSGDGRVEVDARANCSISSGMEQCLSDLTLALINVTYRYREVRTIVLLLKCFCLGILTEMCQWV